MNSIVEFKEVEKSYNKKTVLHNFNLKMNRGDFLCVVGTSGSGKTTVMKMVNGLIRPDRGEVLILGEPLAKKDMISLRRKIGYAIQGNGLFPHMSVKDNIAYVPNLEKRSKIDIEGIVNEMLALVGLPPDIKHRYPDELSGGQQQRVGIARAYANTPDILLMDEPFGAVDSITRYQLQQDLKSIHKKTKCTVMFITHDIHEAFQLSTHILVLDQGKIEQYGTREEVQKYPASSFVKKLIEMTK